MLEKLSQSSGNILGYKVIGKITKDDYKTLSADIDTLGQEISIGLLLDMAAFTGEEIKAQLEKIKFRSDHQKKSPNWLSLQTGRCIIGTWPLSINTTMPSRLNSFRPRSA